MKQWKRVVIATLATALVLIGAVPPSPQTAEAAARQCGWVFHRNNYGSGDWQWHWCKPPMPSIPRVNMGGPRPPLTEKTSVWCTARIISNGDGTGWYRYDSTKHDINFWPDYWHYKFISVQWNEGQKAWIGNGDRTYTSTDCDA